MFLAVAVVVLGLAVGSSVHAPSTASPIVTTTQGQLRGRVEPTLPGDEVLAFRGVPFAEPPVGANRWKPPLPPSPWTGVRDATADAPPCVNLDGTLVPPSEDCLYVNVFTNNLTPAEPVPVMVWLHGGSLIDGSLEQYGPIQNLVSDASAVGKDVVLVAVSYRLALLGFLSLPQLSSGTNAGLLDIQAALAWVQTNAAAFGGDPSRVTLFGQSSGGTAILALLASPASTGLFTRAVSMSGSPNVSLSLQDAHTQNVNGFLANSGCGNQSSADVVACLYAMTAAEVMAATPASFNPASQFPTSPSGDHLPGLPVIDGSILVAPVEAALRSGVVDVPVVLTTMRDEDDIDPTTAVASFTNESFAAWAEHHFKPWGAGVGAAVYDLYSDRDPSQGYYDLLADVGVTCGHHVLANAAAQGRQHPVYLGVHVHSPGNTRLQYNPTVPCRYPYHTWDTVCGFGVYNLTVAPYDVAASDLAYGSQVRLMWLNLSHDGQLSSPWTPVSPSARLVTNLVDASGVTPSPGYRVAACDTLTKLNVSAPGTWWTN